MRLLFTKSSALALFLSLAWFTAGNRTATATETKSQRTPAGQEIADGPFQPTWESLKQYEAPEWYRDAKFGIWAHWGPQCEPEQGDWYARGMYQEGSAQNKFHVAHYGPPSKFGFKDVIHEWKAERWDPYKLMALYKRAGAQYFFALANHHDNFDNWDSKYQPWNSVNMGPEKDIIGGWAKAARANGLRFGVSFHAAHAWTWYEPAQGADKNGPYKGVPYDGVLTKADGKGNWWKAKWWEGYDPQDLYAQNHTPGKKLEWDWDAAKGSSVPDAAYCEKFYNRTVDLIDNYHPDLIYFDDTALPLWPISDVGLKIAAHFYNSSMKQHDGKLEAVLFGKILNTEQRKCMVWDIERGQANEIQPQPWQTDTCIGEWHYKRSIFKQHRYKSAKTVIQMLANIVSKNGNLLLSVPVRADGTIDSDEVKVVEGIAKWMDVNRESIFGTRPWKVFGEGPASAGAALNAQGFNEGKGKPFTAEDVRFTTKGDTLYAIVLGWPGENTTVIKTLATNSPYVAGKKITDVSLLGCKGRLDWSQDEQGLKVKMPEKQPCDYAFVLKIKGILAGVMPVAEVQKRSDGVALTMQSGTMRLQVWSDRVIRVTYAPTVELPANKSLSVVGKPGKSKWKLSEEPELVTLETPALRARVDRKTGAVGFYDLNDKPILQEAEGGREFAPSPAKEVSGTSVRQSFVLAPGERIYGLGQHQAGVWNYRGTTVHLQQRNMEVGLPVLVSSKGYGLLWDNPAVTDVDVGVEGNAGVVRWTSEVGNAVDYYFMYGPAADDVISGYRELTGAAPLMPKWLWGFWQCKERYQTQEEMISIVTEYRKRGVPLDGIIQDWQYWPKDGWGSHEFDPARYPDPAAMVKTLHRMNVHLLISVWPKFDSRTRNFKELEHAGAFYSPMLPSVYPKGQQRWYDPFNRNGRRVYWRQISKQLFSLGFDGWWLDASEPELSGKWGEFRTFQTADGPGVAVFNAYPLMHTAGVYQGQRAQTAKKRVCILTRSAYAGQQRNAAITWSGDIKGSWGVFAKQIPAGLNFSISGIPYWNTDIGGFFGGKPSDKKYQELFMRWFQFGAFNPMFRVHGTGAGKELWRWDEPTQKILEEYIRLRYRLLPYIYSVSWQVTSDGGTMMRPLMMDFANDPNALDVGDQFLFGPGMMVSPVTQEGATNRSVYLPGQGAWYDFWTGKRETGGQRVNAAAPIETMPLFVRAGAILPMGPVVQYAAEKPAAPLEIRVYCGADGAFTLYEDEGDNYNYEKGEYLTIPLTWNEAAGTLTIGTCNGKFPGMLKERTFRMVFVDEGHGAGSGETEHADQVVGYKGKAVVVAARR